MLGQNLHSIVRQEIGTVCLISSLLRSFHLYCSRSGRVQEWACPTVLIKSQSKGSSVLPLKVASFRGGLFQSALACEFSHVQLCVHPHELQPSRLLCPWDFPGRNAGVGEHFLLHSFTLIQCYLNKQIIQNLVQVSSFPLFSFLRREVIRLLMALLGMRALLRGSGLTPHVSVLRPRTSPSKVAGGSALRAWWHDRSLSWGFKPAPPRLSATAQSRSSAGESPRGLLACLTITTSPG